MSTKEIKCKLDHIYTDLSTNVTRIFERQDLHFGLDLVYHSVLQIPFAGKIIKGHLESLVVGDTRCGKTDTCKHYLEHYQLGAFAGGEQTTYAGLIGGLEQLHSRWTVNWGKVPLNHRRLLIIDEMSGMDTDVIAAMSQLRSSGVAEIVKIKSARTNCRTRLAWFSNPRRKGSTVNTFNDGPSILFNLIPQPEDIARFDFAIVLAFDDVDSDLINRPYRDPVEHVYTSDKCRDLILWAWSRKPHNVKIQKQAYEACFSLGKEMYTKYSHSCPLVNPSEQKIKLARMATALACRLFSTENGEDVIVTADHVEYIHEWLNSVYDSPYFGYDQWSKEHMPDGAEIDVDRINEVLDALGVVGTRKMLGFNKMNIKDVENTLNCDRSEAKTIISKLFRANALKKIYSDYVKTPGFIKLIKVRMATKPVEEVTDF